MQNRLTAGQAKALLGVVVDEVRTLGNSPSFNLDFGYGIVGALSGITSSELLSYLDKFKKGVGHLPANQLIDFHFSLGVVNPLEQEIRARIDAKYQEAVAPKEKK